jgi:hypothetical protein
MVIEAASTRLNIDLLYTLKKNGFSSSQIRLSYIYNNGVITFKTYDSLEQLVAAYMDKYRYIIAARKNPFTTDRKQASFGKIAQYGEMLSRENDAIKTSDIEGLCSIGPFCGIESMRLTTPAMGYDLIYNCRDVSDSYSIIPGRSFDIRKDDDRIINMDKFKERIIKFIKDYQRIQQEVYKSWNANLYVDLCYVQLGYVEESMKLYKVFFPLVKEKIDAGLRLSVLDTRYLKRIDL